jgi:putative heme-binding domain-containing protein
MRQSGLAVNATRLSPAELQQIAADAVARGDAVRGEHVYRRPELACMVCHAVGGVGGKLGPDLTSIGASAPPDYLVESLLLPNAKIKEGYHSVLVTTNDGRELNGMITQETATEVLLRDAANVVTSIPVNAITKRTSVGSLMPAGLLDTLLPDERLDLVNFLSQLGKPGAYDASKGGVARIWRLYAVNSRNEHIGAQRVTAGDFSLQDWTSVSTRVDGTLPAEALTAADKDRASMRGLFAAVRFRNNNAGPVNFTLSGNASAAWLDGRPLAVGKQFSPTLTVGTHTIVFQVPQDKSATPLRLSAPGVEFSLE